MSVEVKQEHIDAAAVSENEMFQKAMDKAKFDHLNQRVVALRATCAALTEENLRLREEISLLSDVDVTVDEPEEIPEN